MLRDKITIRRYKLPDYPGVKQNLIEGKMFYETIYSEAKMRTKIGNDPESILVAEVNGEVVGNVYIVSDWGPLLFGLAVRKSCRNRGIGKRLVEEATKILKSKGVV